MTTGSSSNARIHYLDGLRAALMLLGIPFHAALAFSGGGWLVSSPVPSPALAAIADFLHAWRMPAFFIVAGFFAGLLVRRGPGPWLRGRLRRLGIPLVFGMLLTVPLQWLLVGFHRSGEWAGAWSFVSRRAEAPSEWWLLHLWFLLDLLVFCAVTAALVAGPLRAPLGWWGAFVADAAHRRPAATAGAVLLAASVWVLAGRGAWNLLNLDEVANGIVSRDLVVYAPAFAIGVLLGHRRDLLAVVTSRAAAVASVVAAVTASIVATTVSGDGLAAAVRSSAWTVVGLTGACVAVSVARRLLDRRSSAIRWLADASLTVYIVHQPVIVGLAIALYALGVLGLMGWVITIVATGLVAAMVYELVNLTPGLRFALTGLTERQASFLALRSAARRG